MDLIQEHISKWLDQLRLEPSITEADSEELKSHLLDQIDHLKEAGLDDEEAFWVASRRMGSVFEWQEDFRQANNSVIQMQRSLIILAGVLAYFLLYYFIKFSSKLFFITLLENNVNGYIAVDWIKRYLIGAHFAFILFAASIYFLEKKTVTLIENIKLKPKHTILLLLTTIVFSIADTCLLPILKKIIGQNLYTRGQFYDIYFYFDYSFPLIICLGFTFLYFKDYKKVKL